MGNKHFIYKIKSRDTVIPFEPMWAQVKRILKPRGVFVTTASQPFTSALVMSNLEWFRYEWIWEKSVSTGFLHAKNAPMKRHENVLVFSSGIVNHASLTDRRMNYYPQMDQGEPYRKKQVSTNLAKVHHALTKVNYDFIGTVEINSGTRYPTTILSIPHGNHQNTTHSTQKPVALYEYLILTYTNPGDTVLDFCAGSGTTGVAAILTGRNAILIEKQQDYFDIMARRIHEAQMQPNLFNNPERDHS